KVLERPSRGVAGSAHRSSVPDCRRSSRDGRIRQASAVSACRAGGAPAALTAADVSKAIAPASAVRQATRGDSVPAPNRRRRKWSDPMTPDTVVRQWFREVWDEGNEAAVDRLM